ncbi:magnesium transporter [Algihabitans albus]|uniref:magnesium transporter n=1 Tax=Algihabitans albus TaxID=2164067 RepID=UPI0013C30ABB|nr:magnesium transporter [Algihabitans albus]
MATIETFWPGLRRQPHESARAHMASRVPRAETGDSAAVVLDDLRGRHFDCAEAVFVTDRDGRLEGIVHISDLLAARPDQAMAELMEPEHTAVHPDQDQEAVALAALRLGLVAVPVVDHAGLLLGAVPPQALALILRREHDEDLQRLAGISRDGDDIARGALEAPLGDRLKRRLPWLVIGLLASSLATLVVARFEHTLNANVAVAFFVPALVYIAGAIGTQAVSVAVRGLGARRMAMGPLLLRELATGSLIGLALGSIVVLPVWWIFDDGLLALAVALAVLGAGTVSAVIGLALPWGFQRLGFDPALGSGPICTILQDVLSLLIYFTVVTLLLL